jgi:hypothetical protein
LDTNVLSEFARESPNPKVEAKLKKSLDTCATALIVFDEFCVFNLNSAASRSPLTRCTAHEPKSTCRAWQSLIIPMGHWWGTRGQTGATNDSKSKQRKGGKPLNGIAFVYCSLL